MNVKRLIIAALLAAPGLAAAQVSLPLVNCAPAQPCTISGPSNTGTGDDAWLAFGKTNTALIIVQNQLNASITMLGVVTTGTWAATPVATAYGGSGEAGIITGVLKANGGAPFSAAVAADIVGLFSGSPSSSLFMRSDGVLATPSGSGNLSSSGSPTSGYPAFWTSSTTLSQGNFTGDCTTTGTSALTCTKINGTAVTLGGALSTGGAFTTSGAFGVTLTATATTNATLPAGNVVLGLMGLPLTGGAEKTASYTFALADTNTQLQENCSSSGSCTATIPANASVAFPVGLTVLAFYNDCSATISLIIAIGGSDTMKWIGPGTAGSRTLAPCGWATAIKVGTTAWVIMSGGGMSAIYTPAPPAWADLPAANEERFNPWRVAA